jgi:predicted transposase YbfD/YdcC
MFHRLTIIEQPDEDKASVTVQQKQEVLPLWLSEGFSFTAAVQHLRDSWSIENFLHWPSNIQLSEDEHRYRESKGLRLSIVASASSLIARQQKFRLGW